MQGAEVAPTAGQLAAAAKAKADAAQTMRRWSALKAAANARIASLQAEASAALAGFGPSARRLLELGGWLSARTR